MTGASRKAMAAALAVAVASGLAPAANAVGPTQKQAWAACKKKYGKSLVKAEIVKGGKEIRCLFLQPGQAKPMTRNDAYNYCRKKYNATAVIVSKTSKGWFCRYYGL